VWKAALGACIAAQLAVPAIAALQPPPARLGWQMYSGVGSVPDLATAVMADGTTHPASLDDIIANPRPELDWSTYLTRYMCLKYPGAVTVRIETGASREAHAC